MDRLGEVLDRSGDVHKEDPVDSKTRDVVREFREKKLMFQSRPILRNPESVEGAWGSFPPRALAPRTYRGERGADGANRVWVETPGDQGDTPDRSSLGVHLEVRAHSAPGFAWGYGGSGPAQLALALLVDALGDREMAERHHQGFKRAHVARWGDQWSMTAEEIQFFVLSQVTRAEAPARPLFHPGAIVSTPGALTRVPRQELLVALTRHLSGDWGELEEHDWRANDSALRDGSRLLSSYAASNGERFWIITEAHRQATTALLPEEY